MTLLAFIICLVCFKISIVINSHVNIINTLIMSRCQILSHHSAQPCAMWEHAQYPSLPREGDGDTDLSHQPRVTQSASHGGRTQPRSVSCHAGARSLQTFSAIPVGHLSLRTEGSSMAEKVGGLQEALGGGGGGRGAPSGPDCSRYTWTAEGAMVPS